MLTLRNLHVSVGETEILKGVDLTINAGEVHAIMGPNGSGKSTLANVLAGKPEYTVTQGELLYQGTDLQAMAPELRAREGVFLAFQYPVELPGVRSWQFLKTVVDTLRAHQGQEELSIRAFDRWLDGEDGDGGHQPRPHQAIRQRGVLRGGEETQRDTPDGSPGPKAGHSR